VSIELITLLFFVFMFVLIGSGMPVAFSIGAVSVGFCIALWGFSHLSILGGAVMTILQNTNLIAVPLFVFMGAIISQSGIADDLFDTIFIWTGKVKGSLAMGTVFTGVLFGAICGDLVAAIFTITAIALPALLKRSYDIELAIGSIMSSALLSFLIPPSIIIIIFCSATGTSVAQLYLGCIGPGLVLAVLYMSYIGIRCYLRPSMGPSVPPEARPSLRVRIIKLRGVAMPLILLFSMLVAIYSGAVTPMEASGVGAAGALVCAAIKRRLSWKLVWQASSLTLRFTCMLGWMLMATGAFTTVYAGLGADKLAERIALGLPGGTIVVVIVMQAIIFLLGMIMDVLPITLIFGPIFMAVVSSLGFNPIVFGALFMVNIQAALLSPPYGFALYYTKSVVEGLPGGYKTSSLQIWHAALPFLAMQILCLVIILIFPRLVTFLPDLVF
jgi:tripartite ATP-independent transporter DctM subunit